jgi:hypothetical protein
MPASDQVLDYASIDLHYPAFKKIQKKDLHCTKLNRGIAKEIKWRGLQLLSGGNRFIGSILPASVLNAFRRGSLLSSSQQPPPTEETKKKSLDDKIRAKNRQINTRTKGNQMARFSGVIGIQINLMYRERPVIWSVELEYYRVVTAITPVEGEPIEMKTKNKTKEATIRQIWIGGRRMEARCSRPSA